MFYLHHCNVDRIWEAWMKRYGRIYTPDMTFSENLYRGERIGDPLTSVSGTSYTSAAQMLDLSYLYTYDQLP